MNAPVTIRPRESALDMLHLVETLEEMDRAPDAILRTMEIEGAVSGFSGGAHFIRYRGIVGSSTISGAYLIRSWKRACQRKFGLEVRS